jgi:acetyl esterase
LTPEEGRRVFAGLIDLFGQGPEVQRIEDRTIADGVAIRVYVPSAAARLPIVVYFHGGGWVLGDLDTHDTLCRRLSVAAKAVVVSVAYRRSPEFPYPAAVEDCYAATRYAALHAAEWGGDPHGLMVAGDSAGGTLAVGVALQARDRSGPALCGQILIYPAIEPRCDSRSYRQFADGHGLTRSAMVWFWQQYLGAHFETAAAYAAPVRAVSLAGLPPTHLVMAEYDVLHDEGVDFAARLRSAGVPTTSRCYPGMIHGFVHFSEPFDLAKQTILDLGEVVNTLARSRVSHQVARLLKALAQPT